MYFPFVTNSSKIAQCSLSIYSALSDLQLLVTEEQIPRGNHFLTKKKHQINLVLLEATSLKYVFLNTQKLWPQFHAKGPVHTPDNAPEHTCATSSLLESEVSFLSFSGLPSSLPISLLEKGGTYDGTVSSNWGIPKLVSIGNGR